MTRPLIQIDDEIREMTDEELAEHEASIANSQPLPAE
jgi:ribosomal protein L29